MIGSGGMAAGGSVQEPITVTIELEGAFMGVGKADGTQWDSTVQFSGGASQLIAAALSAPQPLVALAAAYADPLVASLEKPDVFGSARLDGPGYRQGPFPLAGNTMAIQDAFNPIWPNRVTFQGVRIDQDVRIRVELTDEDFVNHDPAGVAVVNMTHLMAAHMNRGVFPVFVGDQTQNQILYLTVSVRSETRCSAAMPCGEAFACSAATKTCVEASGTLSWNIANQCSEVVWLRWFDKENKLVWPTDPALAVSVGAGTMIKTTINCLPGSVVCFGAENNARTSYWGVSLDGAQSCDDCCVSCPRMATNAPMVRLTCF